VSKALTPPLPKTGQAIKLAVTKVYRHNHHRLQLESKTIFASVLVPVTWDKVILTLSREKFKPTVPLLALESYFRTDNIVGINNVSIPVELI
jgi:hypothetical protein